MTELRSLLSWLSEHYEHVILLDSNEYTHDSYSRFSKRIAWGCKSNFKLRFGENLNLNDFAEFRIRAEFPVFGIIGYDVKNSFESLKSENPNSGDFPSMAFFEPEFVAEWKDSKWQLTHGNARQFDEILKLALAKKTEESKITWSTPLYCETDFEKYSKHFDELKKHIYRGDIYVMNYCIQFSGNAYKFNPIDSFIRLNEHSPAPFAGFLKYEGKFLLSASMERYLARRGNKIISQPIKGTIKRNGNDDSADKLRSNPKEQQENVMVVDLVRNDLSRTALKGSVKVEELFSVYPFSGVYQMISTIISETAQETSFEKLLRTTFPMGSMTGAPKISAMLLAEKQENFARNWYSGALGYIEPSNDFDFSVVIRSILYDSESGIIRIPVGSAITQHAQADNEYNECMLKVERILKCI
jgi:para-aminobenzoate synthetase component 1